MVSFFILGPFGPHRATAMLHAGLRGELKELAPVLEQKAADAEVMLKQVAIDQAEADVVKEKVSAEEATLAKQSAEVKAVADDAQADLDVAMPALNNAVKALDSLTKADITEVKAFAKPVRCGVFIEPYAIDARRVQE